MLDSSGIYAATSCTDKTLCVYDYYSGECMATMFGHSELVTGLRFTNDCRRLVSASGDGCIFVWKVPHDMVVTMHARLAQQAARAGRRIATQIPNGLHLDNENFGPPPTDFLHPDAYNVDQPDYRSDSTLVSFFLSVLSLLFPIFLSYPCHFLSSSISLWSHSVRTVLQGSHW